MLGVSLTVEHLLPALLELVISFLINHNFSLNKIILKLVEKVLLSLFSTSWINF